MNIQNLVLDINKKCNQIVTANVGEVGSRFLKINIIDNGMPVDLTGVTVYLYAKKADDTKVFNTVKVEDAKQGIVLVEITSQVLAIEGLIKLTLLLVKDNARLATKIFNLKVDETIIDDEAIESANEFGALTESLSKLGEWNSYFEETSGKIEEKYTERLNQVDSQLEQIEKKELVSIMDYGAIGDKINDDTQAIINALSKGRYVTAKGEKHYIISDEIIIPEHVTLDFNNAYVTFINKNACFNLKKSSSIKNVRININSDVILSKSVIYIDGNEVFNVGWSHTPNIENITIEQNGGKDNSSYRANIGIWLDASQNVKNTRCCVTGVLVQNVKAVLLKHIIYMSSSEAPNNQNNVFITSNTFRNIFGYNCACFIKDEVLYNNSGKVGVGSNVYENLHFQPADDAETCYVDICGNGNSFLNPIFWDNSRPSNNTNQIIIRGSHNHISGPKIPPYKSSYVNIMGEYNYYHGNTYGIPTQYYGGKYISGRGYQKEWKNKLMPITYTYDRIINDVRSGLIEGSNDVKSIDMPLTYGDLGNGYTKITFNSIGVCDKTTQTRRFYLGYYNSNFKCGVNTDELYASQYNFKGEYIIRKYEEGYADIVISIKCAVNNTTFTKVHNERHYNIKDDMSINPRLLIGSTNEGGLTQIYSEIKIDFHE